MRRHSKKRQEKLTVKGLSMSVPYVPKAHGA
jgi:hypothetical protein